MKCSFEGCDNEARYYMPGATLAQGLCCGICPLKIGVPSILIRGNPDPEELMARYDPTKVLGDVALERARQFKLQAAGRFRHTPSDQAMPDADRLASIVEEVGEVARAMMETRGAVNDKHGEDLYKELVQVAAIAVAWMQHLDAEELKRSRR